ncbi:MAG: hypothetical protein NVS9B1_21210 [Candidatus Dormibacteraceae bacterium]
MGRTILRQQRETHFTGSEAVRDVVIGMSDGLTVPFALAMGISGAVAASGLVVTAGMAEIAAGSIAMGLGGYLARFGYVKGRFTGVSPFKSAFQTDGIGGIAATVAFFLARLFSHA